MLKLPDTTSRDEYIRLRGGFDLLTPLLDLKAGVAREMQNWECSITGGYTRVAGYERFDGRPNPSEATYLTLTANVTGTIAVGDTIYGATSGATGVVTYRSGTLVAYTKSSGSFQAGESIKVPNAAGAVQGSVTDLGGSETDADFDARMLAAAADEYRGDILAVPGSGPIRGLVYYRGTLYAFRDNAGATALAIYKSSAGGWTSVPLLNTISFTAGTSAYTAGSTLTQGGASATIKRVCLESGTWAGGTAAGKLIIGTVTGGPFAAGAAAGGGACTLSGAEAAITLQPGGTMEFAIGTVEANSLVYGCDGVNKAFEFDGEYLAPITTGNSPDAPGHVMVHSGHLFLSFANSVQNSGTGLPFNWTATAGAAEFLADGEVSGMKPMQGNQGTAAAAISNDQSTQILYGTSDQDFQLVTFDNTAGAKPMSMQRLGELFMLDDRGVVSLAATQAYGNFAPSAITLNIRPWLQSRRNIVTASLVNREKSQYRLFFSDGSGLYVTLANGRLLGCGVVQFPDIVRCACEAETSDGAETAFFGSDDGVVYRLDAGTSFDGDAIDHNMTLVYSHQGGPRINKRYRRATFEVQSDAYATFDVTFDLAYGSTEREQQSDADTIAIAMQTGAWDSGAWDSLTWDGRALAPETLSIDGSGENLSVRIAGSSAICQSFTINSLILTYSVRGRKRS